jgi:FkbM family methyltransferase
VSGGHSTQERFTGALRWLGGRRLVLPLTARVLCAATVRESPAFFAREVTRPSGIHCYHLRENGVEVALRHSAGDGATLAEVFHRHDYQPPPEVANAIGEPREILDLGANVGLFGAFAVSRWSRARIRGYEADPANVAVHERTIAANGLGARWSVVCAAAGAHDGEVELAAGRAMGSFVVAPGTDPGVATIHVPIRDVLSEVSCTDLVKMDMEGGEWEILLDPRFRQSPPRAMVLEYHPHLCPDADPRAAAEQALAQAKLSTASIWHSDDGYGMVWAWRA